MERTPIRVAIVGAGAAGLYAVGALLDKPNLAVEIDVFERLPTPWGLVRAGVAPDHPQKKLIIDRLFDFYLNNPRVRFFGNIHIGADIPVAELRQWYHAVIFTIGANGDTKLGIPGEALPGCFAARDFVGFYNGHPDFREIDVDLSTKRAVIVGNGNVALDIARILTLSHDELARTDMADHALAVLDASDIEEVVILGRRGPENAAYNAAELEEFNAFDSVDVSVDGTALAADDGHDQSLDWTVRRKLKILGELHRRPRKAGRKRVVFRFFATPLAFHGDGRVEQVEIARTGTAAAGAPLPEMIDTRLVFRACGYRGLPTEGLPFDQAFGVISNQEGRVFSEDGVVSGVYVAGWIKRGCRGIIGSNKQCARETVARMLEDFAAGHLDRTLPDRKSLRERIAKLAPAALPQGGWLRIDRAERRAGRLAGRPRVKMAEHAALIAAAARRPASQKKV